MQQKNMQSDSLRAETLNRIISETVNKTRLNYEYDDDEWSSRGRRRVVESELSSEEAAGAYEEKGFVWVKGEASSSSSKPVAADGDREKVMFTAGGTYSADDPSKIDLDRPVARREPEVKVNIPAQLLLASLIDQHLQSFEMDASTRRSLFNNVVENLHRVGVMPKVFGSDEFSSLRLDIFCLILQVCFHFWLIRIIVMTASSSLHFNTGIKRKPDSNR